MKVDTKKFAPVFKDYPHIIYGGDYNPEQWKNRPDILREDMRLMKKAGINSVSIGIFSWAELEPREDFFDFSFMDMMMDMLWKNGINVILATPSGARPAWMSKSHPEVLRVNADRTKNLHGERHNHCYTSLYYRRKVQQINGLLAQRYMNHPALKMWHISNEYGGECHCELCRKAFQNWLKDKYDNDLDKLNNAYWASFWSHTYTDWEQIEPPSRIGERSIHALTLDWKRFVTYQTAQFIRTELEPIRKYTPDIPVTTNLQTEFYGLDYHVIKNEIDVISWDNYPEWHVGSNKTAAIKAAFNHDIFRSLKHKPFMLMESTPSNVNWLPVNKLKRPGMNTLASLQAVAHGSDTVQYFQWRKSRGGVEKLHGAVVDHCGHENTRVFREAEELGAKLKQLDCIVGTRTKAEVAVIFDWDNRWAIDDLQGMARHNRNYTEMCKKHYSVFWERGINVDIIDSMCDFTKYKLIAAPMLYMIKPGVKEKIKSFVENGGTFVATYLTGWVNDTDLCYLGGFPAEELKDVFGIWAEELDVLCDGEKNTVVNNEGQSFDAVSYCEIIHPGTAQTLASYTEDFYKNTAAHTVNYYGSGAAHYIAFRDQGDYIRHVYDDLIRKLNIEKAAEKLPDSVSAHTREDENIKYLFVENYGEAPADIEINGYEQIFGGSLKGGILTLGGFDCAVLKSVND